MRILVVTNMYPPHAYGGYEQSCMDVVEKWREAGHSVLVLTSRIRVRGEPEPSTDERRSVWRDLYLYWDDHEIVDPSPWRRFVYERSNEACVRRAVSMFRPDVASAWAMGAMSFGLLAKLRRLEVPVVSVICDEWPIYGPVVDGWLRALGPRPRLARAVSYLTGLSTAPPAIDSTGPSCFVSEHLRRVCREKSIWSFPESGVVYSGIEHEDFPYSGHDRRWRWRLLYVGRIDPRKGIDTALRALASCPPNATLEMVGRGDDRYLDELHALAAELGLSDRVQFTSCPRSQLAKHYGAADALVFPAVWEEPFGLVPVEAMACGTPVVGTSVGGAAEFLVDGVNCLTFSPGDSNSLVGRLHRLADDTPLRRKLIEGGVQTASDLSVERLADELESWHRWAAEGGPRPQQRRLSGHVDRPG
jgi:glycogen synthase